MVQQQTGLNVVAENGQTRRYFHYNDLGTVMAQTKQNGTWEGVWEPDHFGNYRYKWSTSPARPELGLTGQFFDPALKLGIGKYLPPRRGERRERRAEARIQSIAQWNIPPTTKKELLAFLDDLELGKVNRGRRMLPRAFSP
jgi:hypothetical protein